MGVLSFRPDAVDRKSTARSTLEEIFALLRLVTYLSEISGAATVTATGTATGPGPGRGRDRDRGRETAPRGLGGCYLPRGYWGN
eukprot:887139-Prorocentrum_minimum.AAC.1